MFSQGNLQLFTDFDLSCESHPLTNDLVPLKNEQAIARALRSLVQMVRYDVPFDPYLHVGIQEYLFLLVDMTTATSIQSRLEWAIKKYEPRITIMDLIVNINDVGNGYDVTLTYQINGLNKIHSLNFYFKRVR